MLVFPFLNLNRNLCPRLYNFSAHLTRHMFAVSFTADTPDTLVHLLGDHLLGNHLLGDHLLGGHLLGDQLLGEHLLGGHLLGGDLLGGHLLGGHLLLKGVLL